jgi:hypothetical protein
VKPAGSFPAQTSRDAPGGRSEPVRRRRVIAKMQGFHAAEHRLQTPALPKPHSGGDMAPAVLAPGAGLGFQLSDHVLQPAKPVAAGVVPERAPAASPRRTAPRGSGAGCGGAGAVHPGSGPSRHRRAGRRHAGDGRAGSPRTPVATRRYRPPPHRPAGDGARRAVSRLTPGPRHRAAEMAGAQAQAPSRDGCGSRSAFGMIGFRPPAWRKRGFAGPGPGSRHRRGLVDDQNIAGVGAGQVWDRNCCIWIIRFQ